MKLSLCRHGSEEKGPGISEKGRGRVPENRNGLPVAQEVRGAGEGGRVIEA